MMKKLRAPYLLILIFCMLALAGCSGGLGRPSDLKVNETDWVLSWSPVENATASTTYIVEIDGREYVSSKTSYSLEGLEEGSYKIRVKATDALGQTGDSKWSDAFVFTKPYENGLVYTLTNANTEYEVTRVGSARGDIEIGDVYRGKPVTSIAEKAFYSSSGVKSIVVGKNVREIGDYAFSRSDAVQVVLPAGVQKIGQCAFQRCLSLQSVTLPAGLTDIGDHAFQRCSKLEEVNLPDSVTHLGRNPFAGSPVTLSLSASHPALELRGDVLIERSTGKLLSFPCVGSEPAYEIPGDIREIGEFAFAYCKDLFTLTVPANVEIAENAFYRNEAIEAVTLPEGLTVIKENTFWGCINLKTVEIPGSVTEIGAFAFNCCQAMETLTFPKSLVTLGEGAFQGCLALREVTVPSAIGIIPARAFDACIRLERVEIQEGITQIAPYAFYDCEMLQVVSLPESLTRIDRYAFYRCAILETTTIPTAVNRFGDEVFGMCPKLTVTASKDSEAAAYCAGNNVPFAEK